MNRWFTFFGGAAVAVAFLVTCGGVPGANGETGDGIYKSGTRIKVKVLRSDDGAQVLAGLFDSQRQEDCVVRETADGFRCIPVSVAFLSPLYFADAECTKAAPYVPTGGEAPAYWIEVDTNGVVKAIGRAGAKVEAAFGGTPCVSGPPYRLDVYERGDEVPLQSFGEFDLATLD